MELSRNQKIAAIATLTALAVTAGGVVAVWPALTRPEPPLEARGDDGLRISVVKPPKAATAKALQDFGRLDVGLPAALPRAKPPVVAAVIASPSRDLPTDANDRTEQVADRRDRDGRQHREQRAETRSWEDEPLARHDDEDRLAWEQLQRDRRRWDEAGDPDRYSPADDRRHEARRYDLQPLPQEEHASPGRW